MRAEGMLTVRITGSVEDGDIVIRVIDDGVGMSEETIATMMSKESTTGLGIAVKNVQDRIRGNFGPDSRMEVTSEIDKGTTVTILLNREVAESSYVEREKLKQSTVPDIPNPVVTGDRL